MLLNFKLPVYEVRAFYSLEHEGSKTFVITRFRRYTLDDKSLPGDYADRRIQLFMQKNKEFPLYPLKKRISTLPQLLNSKAKYFITEDGKLVTYNKTKYHTIVCKKVVSSTRIFNGKYHCYVSGCTQPFLVNQPYEYLSLIQFKNSYLLFDAHLEQPEKVRYRIMI